MQRLWVRYGYSRVVVVAHSMGGLVARAFVNRARTRGDIALFVTMSTPWQGQAGAALGVEQAPVVAPSWYDMAPDSDFLQSLLAEPLPREIPFHLLFTYGDPSALIRGANDGAVTLSSQLDDRAQHQAVQVYGFDVGHGAILRSPAAAAELNRILATIE
jgi:pimeloyl-ACP methyl ester carboxylesterase